MNITKEFKTSLYEYILEAKNDVIPEWDGHEHLFNHKNPLPKIIFQNLKIYNSLKRNLKKVPFFCIFK